MNVTDGVTNPANLMQFSWFEYVVFFCMLGISLSIGVFFGCFRPQDTVADYLLGGKKMNVFPVSMSLLASLISGITLIGIPSETYLYGTQLYAIILCNIIVSSCVYFLYLPVLYKLQFVSLFEYLDKRFNRTVRKIASLMYAVLVLTYIPVVIYVPALAFTQVSGLSLHVITPIVCVICIFYTTLGGLKAVVWSDAIQSLFTLGSVIVVMIVGSKTVGGLGKVWEVSEKWERLEFFNFNPDPLARNTFWTVVVGSSFSWFALLALNPAVVQRYIALPSYRDAQIATIVFCLGIIIVKSIVTVNGLIIFTKYHNCDPIVTKVIEKPGQLLPMYIMDVAGNFPGLSGLFIAGVFSAALSTMSTGINTMSGTIYEDFIKPCLSKQPSEKMSSFVMKCIAVILGIICLLLVFVVEKLGGIMQMAISLAGISAGPIFFVFTFGMFFPWGTTKGAIAGSVASLCLMTWIVFGAQMAIFNKEIRFVAKQTSIEGCPANMSLPEGLNGTRFGEAGVGTRVEFDDGVLLPFRISYLHYSTLGALVATVVGILVSMMTGTEDLEALDPRLVHPWVRSFLPKPKKHRALLLKGKKRKVEAPIV